MSVNPIYFYHSLTKTYMQYHSNNTMNHLLNGNLRDDARTAEKLEQYFCTPQKSQSIWSNSKVIGTFTSYNNSSLNNSGNSNYSLFSSGSKGNCGFLCV